jgi:hypothetical protein
MPTTLNREAWEKLIDEDVAYLDRQPRTLEREHIAQCLMWLKSLPPGPAAAAKRDWRPHDLCFCVGERWTIHEIWGQEVVLVPLAREGEPMWAGLDELAPLPPKPPVQEGDHITLTMDAEVRRVHPNSLTVKLEGGDVVNFTFRQVKFIPRPEAL